MKYSLFIGRYQPFHLGHKTLIEKVLKEGKNACIAIKITEMNEYNPYYFMERVEFIRAQMSEWGDRVLIMAIPDIEEVCYGRKVGWKVRRIKLPKKIEAISATKIREANGNRSH